MFSPTHGKRLFLLAGFALLLFPLWASAGERVTLLEETYNASPWNAAGQWATSGPTYIETFLWKNRIPADIVFCDLDPAVGNYLTIRWSSTSSRVLMRLSPKSTATPVIAASRPVGTLRFKLLNLTNSAFTLYNGGPYPTYTTNGTFEVSTEYDCVNELGKYDAVGKQTFEIKPIDPLLPYSGALVLISYRIVGDSDNGSYIPVYEAVRAAPEHVQNEISVNALSDREVVLSGVRGEPLCFSLVFSSPVSRAFVRADLSAADVSVRWVSKWKPFLLNDPSLGGTAAEYDADALVETAAGGNAAPTDKAWVSFTVPADAESTSGQAPSIGTVSVRSSGSVVNRVTVRLEVYPFKLPQEAAVRPGIFVVAKRYSPDLWDQVHAWMSKARIEWATNPVQVPTKCINGRDPSGAPYAQDDLLACFRNRRAHGLGERQILPITLVSYEIWRYLFGPEGDKLNLGGWIGQSLAEKIEFTRKQYDPLGVSDVWVYSYDEAQGDTLMKLIPMLQFIRRYPVRIFAAIHPRYWEIPAIRDAIDFWIMAERDYLFNRRARDHGKLSGKYAYPFTDTHGYAVHRKEFLKCLYSEVDFYFNYALNDINGTTFDNQRKMCLVIPTTRGLIESESSEGFIRGVYDMRYVLAVRNTAKSILDRDPSSPTAQQALRDLQALHPKLDWNQVKLDLADVIGPLTEELYVLDPREAAR
ncbi:MAG: hypothetical protein V2A58_15330 [Planctomycetota bacterium]